MNDTSRLISDEKRLVQPRQLKRLVTELRELAAETFEVEDVFDLGQNAPAADSTCNSCFATCTNNGLFRLKL